MVTKKSKSNKDELVYHFDMDAIREISMLWINNIAPSQAPHPRRKALEDWYRHFDCAQLGVSLFLLILSGDCKTPAQLRQRACEALDKLNDCSANGASPLEALLSYHAWAKERGIASPLLERRLALYATARTPVLSVA